MKFITEQDLRSRYRAEPFTSYTPEPGTRLTPGARQFLTDRGIRLEADGPKKPAAPTMEQCMSTSRCGTMNIRFTPCVEFCM